MTEQLEQAVFPNGGYILLAAGHEARALDDKAKEYLAGKGDVEYAHQLQAQKAAVVVDCAGAMLAFDQQGGEVTPETLNAVAKLAHVAQAAVEDEDFFAMATLLTPPGRSANELNDLERLAWQYLEGWEKLGRFNLQTAIELATAAHLGHKDQGTGAPYIGHPLRVMRALEPYGEDAQIIGVLHDTVEDCPWVTLQLLRELRASKSVVKGVDSVSRREGEAYHSGLIKRSKRDENGKVVKLADNLENSNEDRLVNFTPEDAERRRQKYAQAREILLKGDEWLAEQVEPIKAELEALYAAEAA